MDSTAIQETVHHKRLLCEAPLGIHADCFVVETHALNRSSYEYAHLGFSPYPRPRNNTDGPHAESLRFWLAQRYACRHNSATTIDQRKKLSRRGLLDRWGRSIQHHCQRIRHSGRTQTGPSQRSGHQPGLREGEAHAENHRASLRADAISLLLLCKQHERKGCGEVHLVRCGRSGSKLIIPA